MEDVTKSLQASASLLFFRKKGGAGLGRKDQNKGKPCCTHESTHLSEQFSKHQERCRFSPPEDGTAGFAGPASKESEKEARALKYGKVTYMFFGARK
jgi:hypothetical protein